VRDGFQHDPCTLASVVSLTFHVSLMECFNRHQVDEGVLSASSRSVYGFGSLDPSSIFNCVFPWDIWILMGDWRACAEPPPFPQEGRMAEIIRNPRV
jgi:hypothetical protein